MVTRGRRGDAPQSTCLPRLVLERCALRVMSSANHSVCNDCSLVTGCYRNIPFVESWATKEIRFVKRERERVGEGEGEREVVDMLQAIQRPCGGGQDHGRFILH